MKDTHSGHATAVTELRGTAEQGRLVLAEVLDRLDGAFPAAAGRHRLGPGAYLVPLGGGGTLLVALAPAGPARDRSNRQLVLSATLLHRAGLPDADVERALDCLRAVPFTGCECDAFTEQLPLLAGLPKRVPDKPLGECGLLLVGHLLSDLVVQTRTLIALGARPEAMTVLDQGCPHRLRRRVEAHLAGLGIAVLPASDVETALRLHAARVMEPSVVVDDGGLVAPVLATLVPELVPAYRGLVEQSMAGVAELEELQATGTALPLPVFSVAQSKVKRGIEAHWIAESVLRALRDLLPADAFDGTPALVLGFGAVGEQVAAVLRGQRMRVAVHDTDWPRLLAAHEAGYLTAPEIPALLDGHRPLLIVASTGRTARTGRPALAGEDLDFLAGECFVASVSGRGAEIDLSALASRADRIEDLGRAGMRYVLPAGPITVLPDGLPLNTPRGEPATSTPTRQSDLTMAAAAWGACTLARPGHAFGPGPDVTATDASIAESGLLERYYQLYGPGSGGDARSTRARPRGVRRRARISEA